MAVYLLHFDSPVSEAHTTQHYIGFADGGLRAVLERIHRHQEGNGAKLVSVAAGRGIGFRVANLGTHTEETERSL